MSRITRIENHPLNACRTHTYLRTSNFSSMVHGFDRMPSIMSRCIWMFSNTSAVIGSSVDNFLWVSLQLQANKKDISIKRISGTRGACYLSSYCMSYFINTLLLLNHFYDPFYFKGRIKSTISPLNLTPVFIITFYLATEHKKVNQTDCHGQTIQKWACCYTSELCIGLSYAGGKEMKRSLNLPEKGVERTRA